MTMLSIIQDVTDLMGIPRPTVVVGSTDAQTRQLYALLNEEGGALSRRGDWQALTTEWTFTTTSATVQTNTPFPPDYRKMIPDTIFDRTQSRRVIGPLTAQEWQACLAYPIYTQVYLSFRERGGQALITPVPPADDTIAYEYVSTYWAVSSLGRSKASFTADDDVPALDESLLKLGLRWRWKQAKGLDYAEDMATYEREVLKALAFDGGARTLDAGGGNDRFPLANVPEGGFGI